MSRTTRFDFRLTAVVVVVVGLLPLISTRVAAQDQRLNEEYQAQAMGQGTQLGQTFNVTIHIQEYSTPEERQALVDAFNKKGSEGLFNALNKMKSKGHIEVTGTLGYDISFVRKLPGADGVKLRILTDRPITFGEAWSDSRSSDYNLSAVELDLKPEKSKSTGTLIPACQFDIDKKTKELGIEDYQNPWKLVDVIDRSKK
jgi:hypothetical protein